MQRNVLIAHNLDTTPLLIKTNSVVGSRDFMALTINNDTSSDSIYFNFRSPPQYFIRHSCQKTNKNFPSSTTLPSEVNKVWKITKLPGPRITLHCNGLLVLDIKMSKTCSESTFWITNVKTLKFNPKDKASDYYKPGTPLPGKVY